MTAPLLTIKSFGVDKVTVPALVMRSDTVAPFKAKNGLISKRSVPFRASTNTVSLNKPPSRKIGASRNWSENNSTSS